MHLIYPPPQLEQMRSLPPMTPYMHASDLPTPKLVQMRSLPEWSRMQVAEQVEALLADGASRSAEASRPAERLAIPASYTPGLTLIACAGSEAARRMEAGAGADCMRGLGGGA